MSRDMESVFCGHFLGLNVYYDYPILLSLICDVSVLYFYHISSLGTQIPSSFLAPVSQVLVLLFYLLERLDLVIILD